MPESPSGFFLESLPFIKFYVFNCWLRWAFAACSGCSPAVASGGSCPPWARGTHRGGCSSRRAQTLGVWVSVAAELGPRSFCTRVLRLRLVGSRAWTQQLGHMNLAAPQHGGSSWVRGQTHVPCIGRRTQPLYHQGSPRHFYLFTKSLHILTWSS